VKRGWVENMLCRRVLRKGPHGVQRVLVQPDERLVLYVKFMLGAAVCLSALEVACLGFLGTWNSEVFAAITGLVGTVSGVIVSHRV
jgi:uncharacterized membrane protein YjjP (DUF1212 family)